MLKLHDSRPKGRLQGRCPVQRLSSGSLSHTAASPYLLCALPCTANDVLDDCRQVFCFQDVDWSGLSIPGNRYCGILYFCGSQRHAMPPLSRDPAPVISFSIEACRIALQGGSSKERTLLNGRNCLPGTTAKHRPALWAPVCPRPRLRTTLAFILLWNRQEIPSPAAKRNSLLVWHGRTGGSQTRQAMIIAVPAPDWSHKISAISTEPAEHPIINYPIAIIGHQRDPCDWWPCSLSCGLLPYTVFTCCPLKHART